MITLKLIYQGREEGSFEFKDDKASIVVGREKGCDIVVENVGVSRRHCEFRLESGLYFLYDLNSNNGVYVNGQKITRYQVQSSDEISLGKFVLKAEIAGQPKIDLGPDAEEKVALAFGNLVKTVDVDSRDLEKVRRTHGSGVKAFLVCDEKKVTVFVNHATTFIGSGEKCEIRVGGWFAPKRWALVLKDDVGYRVLNLSDKALLVNGKKIDDEVLKEGDEIGVGAMKFKFFLGAPK